MSWRNARKIFLKIINPRRYLWNPLNLEGRLPSKSKKNPEYLPEACRKKCFHLKGNKSKTNQDEKGCLGSSQVSPHLTRHKAEPLYSDSTYKLDCSWVWKKYHKYQENSYLNSKENLTQDFEGSSSVVSPKNIGNSYQAMLIAE